MSEFLSLSYIGTTEPRRSDREPHRWAVARCWKCKGILLILIVYTEKLHYGALGMSENRKYISPQWQDLANHKLF